MVSFAIEKKVKLVYLKTKSADVVSHPREIQYPNGDSA